ncbi:MAG: PHP domain-containing protein [archaeon]|jgi:hypothetical protein|nr:PHP domain-containing protein [archaeon]MDD2477921.1 PHP domain-containing protein [Candidatus ainarchaeum sp.]MDD3084452.1 PHP domain-containing protein [Candidatus ainarchaeum sp.]MDD4220914.1 PHP domain-containing protein [Candidatus ainarchaeum sp.]MDD4662906.1 PHP domain-containing protein [Candidatus ainarchaeum sp.]
MIYNTDLHLHTHYSDGVLSPKSLVELAKKRKLQAISITDHDTTDGLREGSKAAKENKIELINGVEIQGLGSEILGYFFDEDNNSLQSLLENQKKQRTKYVLKKIEGLNDLNIDISIDEVFEKSKPADYLLTTYVAEVMIEKGYVKSIQEAFDKYLRKIPVKLEESPLRLKKIIGTIKDANGLCILPHPWYLKPDFKYEIETFIIKLKKYGLDGVEVIGYIPEELKTFENSDFMETIKIIANKYDLLLSGGSDFHGEKIHPDNILGKYNIPYDYVKKMKERLI